MGDGTGGGPPDPPGAPPRAGPRGGAVVGGRGAAGRGAAAIPGEPGPALQALRRLARARLGARPVDGGGLTGPAGRERAGAGGAPETRPGEGLSKSVAKALRAGIGRGEKRGISTILLRRRDSIGAFATDLDKQRRRGPIVRDDRGAPPLHAPELHRREEPDAPCPRIARDVSQHLALPEIMRHDIFRRSRRKGRGRGQWSPPPSCSRTWGTSGPTTATVSLTPPREPGALTTRAPVASREVTPTSPRDRPDSGVLVSP